VSGSLVQQVRAAVRHQAAEGLDRALGEAILQPIAPVGPMGLQVQSLVPHRQKQGDEQPVQQGDLRPQRLFKTAKSQGVAVAAHPVDSSGDEIADALFDFVRRTWTDRIGRITLWGVGISELACTIHGACFLSSMKQPGSMPLFVPGPANIAPKPKRSSPPRRAQDTLGACSISSCGYHLVGAKPIAPYSNTKPLPRGAR